MVVETLETCPACGRLERISPRYGFGMCDRCVGVAMCLLGAAPARSGKTAYDEPLARQVYAHLCRLGIVPREARQAASAAKVAGTLP